MPTAITHFRFGLTAFISAGITIALALRTNLVQFPRPEGLNPKYPENQKQLIITLVTRVLVIEEFDCLWGRYTQGLL